MPHDELRAARTLYLDLMKQTLTDLIYDTADGKNRTEGRVWPSRALTMVGLKRLENIQECIEDVLAKKVPGDVIETGVWRGGATIFMRAVLKAHGVTNRRVWVADSFQGLPRPNAEKYPADAGDEHYKHKELAIGIEQVRENFAKFGLLDDQVAFLKGWFRETLPDAPIKALSVMRLDGDIYESTMDALVHLYPRLSPGGYVLVDDYGAIPSCKLAIDDYRKAHGVHEPIRKVDWTGICWQKSNKR